MSSRLAQIGATIRINLRSLRSRKWSSATTVLTVAFVVIVLLFFQSMSNGFVRTLQSAGSQDVALVLSKGSDKEINSALTAAQVGLIGQAPGIATRDGEPWMSGELYVIVNGMRKGADRRSSLLLRGLGAHGPSIRKGFTLLEGRMFSPGLNEIVTGRQVRDQYQGMQTGSTIRLGTTEWTIVGVFTTAGSVVESELWADSSTVRSMFKRPAVYQSVRAKLATAGGMDQLRQFVAADPRLNLSVQTEAEYVQHEASGTSDLIMKLGWPLAIALALGALAGAVNAMYNSVAARSAEIATLRALGFHGFSAFVGTLVESLTLAVAGALAGIATVFFCFDGRTAATLGSGFTQQLFSFQLSLPLIVEAVVVAMVIGVAGGLLPAIRAARMSIVASLHD